MFSTAPSFRSSHSCNIYSIVFTRMQWHSKIITFSKQQFVICLGHSYENVYCFDLLMSYKIALRRSVYISTGLSNLFMYVRGRCTCSSSTLRRATVPHDFSHKTNNCQYISHHQEIDRLLQVSVTDSIERVSEIICIML